MVSIVKMYLEDIDIKEMSPTNVVYSASLHKGALELGKLTYTTAKGVVLETQKLTTASFEMLIKDFYSQLVKAAHKKAEEEGKPYLKNVFPLPSSIHLQQMVEEVVNHLFMWHYIDNVMLDSLALQPIQPHEKLVGYLVGKETQQGRFTPENLSVALLRVMNTIDVNTHAVGNSTAILQEANVNPDGTPYYVGGIAIRVNSDVYPDIDFEDYSSYIDYLPLV